MERAEVKVGVKNSNVRNAAEPKYMMTITVAIARNSEIQDLGIAEVVDEETVMI